MSAGHGLQHLPIVTDWPAGYRTTLERLAFELLTHPSHRTLPALPLLPPVPAGPTNFPAGGFEALLQACTDARPGIERVLRAAATAPAPAIALRMVGDAWSARPAVTPSRAEREVALWTATRMPTAAARARWQPYDRVVVGSRWAAEYAEHSGAQAVETLPTGVDLTEFAPAPRRGDLAGHFLIYSAGRFVHRKGPDLVLRAVAAFRERHPDTLLLTAWQSPWPELARDLLGTAFDTLPDLVAGRFDFASWAVSHGFPAGSLVDVGDVPQAVLAALLSEVDVALFPSRAESDHNGRLLECLAAGVPVIASANTGHRDVLDAADTWPLVDQRAVPIASEATVGWGESSVDEIVAHLEQIYADRAAARTRAAAARARLTRHAWRTVIEQLHRAVRR